MALFLTGRLAGTGHAGSGKRAERIRLVSVHGIGGQKRLFDRSAEALVNHMLQPVRNGGPSNWNGAPVDDVPECGRRYMCVLSLMVADVRWGTVPGRGSR